MKTCDNCGAEYFYICRNCTQSGTNFENEPGINTFSNNKTNISDHKRNDSLRVTVIDKFFGFASIAGIVAVIVLAIILFNKLPGSYVHTVISADISNLKYQLLICGTLYATCVMYALMPQFLWSLRIARIQLIADVDSNVEPSLSWLFFRKVIIGVFFLGALLMLFFSFNMFFSVLNGLNRSELVQNYIII